MRALAGYRHALKADWAAPADVKKDFRRANVLRDLEPMIGKSNRVYEVLNHKRSLTLKMIWRLHEQLGIPAEH